jgi:hypothetical protein
MRMHHEWWNINFCSCFSVANTALCDRVGRSAQLVLEVAHLRHNESVVPHGNAHLLPQPVLQVQRPQGWRSEWRRVEAAAGRTKASAGASAAAFLVHLLSSESASPSTVLVAPVCSESFLANKRLSHANGVRSKGNQCFQHFSIVYISAIFILVNFISFS